MEREPFKFGQDPTIRSMQADQKMLEHILTILPKDHDARAIAEQDLAYLNQELEKVKENERNNQPGK